MGTATIRDVAARAAVSVASVSRALNAPASVSPPTRARIIAAADALGYVPHAGARSLSIARAHALGVVMPDLHGEFYSEFLRGMDREASRCGRQLLLSNVHGDEALAGQALQAMRGRVDGLVVMAPHLSAEVLAALPATLPAVLVNCSDRSGRHPSLTVDNAAGADAIVAHLKRIGRRRILHIAGPEGNRDAAERQAGFLAAMRRHLPGGVASVFPGDFREEAGEAAARAILRGDHAVDAVFAANDMMAIACLHTLREAGVAVPGEVAVAGFDDVPLARYLSLTTVRVRIAELGARAVRRIVSMLDAQAGIPQVEHHLPELVVRATTGPALTDVARGDAS